MAEPANAAATQTANPRTLKFGVIGIGNAGGGVLSMMRAMPEIDIVAVADVRPHALQAFEREFGGRGYDSVEKLCQDPEVEAVWVATPNPYHAPHTIMAAQHGKHVVVEKPMALSLQEAEAMIETAEKNQVKLFSGHTRAFDPPVQTIAQIVKSGEVGPIKAMNVMSFTPWMLRPRMPEEVEEARGGGVAFRQAPHQIDTLRFLGGGLVHSVRGMTGTWMEGRMGAPGYYTGYLEFQDGTPASITYNGYGYFLASELLPWVRDGRDGSAEERAQSRSVLRTGTWDEGQAKDEMRFGGVQRQPDGARLTTEAGPRRAHFMSDLGLLIVSCERGLLRQSPEGIYVYNDEGQREEPIHDQPGATRNDPTLQEVYDAIVRGQPIFHDGRWGMATLEVQLALMESARTHREVTLSHQVAVPAHLHA
ncbi:MAG: phthalate 4,5-cis-dihydrodiol dehydrogenase [Chloroflexota bacterium]|jgi:phthalate 4,5-cis-dihydrodiol dehydrogenase|nr:phthalate 4,5-cis-dihydrodiol dehydrogenase [Chloroflexota bacterium]